VQTITIIGVVKNSAQMSYTEPPEGEVHRPIRQFFLAPFMSTIVARTVGEPLTSAAALKSAVWEVDPNQPVTKVESLDDTVANFIWSPRFAAWIFSILGSVAVLLTALGVFSVISYTASLRTREVGIHGGGSESRQHRDHRYG
jgi:hypothetical protein